MQQQLGDLFANARDTDAASFSSKLSLFLQFFSVFNDFSGDADRGGELLGNGPGCLFLSSRLKITARDFPQKLQTVTCSNFCPTAVMAFQGSFTVQHTFKLKHLDCAIVRIIFFVSMLYVVLPPLEQVLTT